MSTPARLNASEYAATEVGCLLRETPSAVAASLSLLDWDFADSRTDEFSHSLHPYPAKFPPPLPRRVIEALSEVGDLVLDPFGGGGTTAVEAVAAERRFVGLDANPVGNVIARAKLGIVDSDSAAALHHLEAGLMAADAEQLLALSPPWLPSIPNREKWYDDVTFHVLGVVREWVLAIEPDAARQLALVAFLQTASRVSFQDSETRYSSKPRPVNVLDVPRTLLAEIRRMRRVAARAPATDVANPTVIVEGDARERSSLPVADGTVGLIVTSPPYPNAYDYHLYHRFRLFWLGAEPRQLKSVEIGSHLNNQSLSDPAEAYVTDMARVLRNCFVVLRPTRYAVFVVGDGLIRGETFVTATAIARLAEETGFEHVATVSRALPTRRRSVTKAGRRLDREQLVFLRRPSVRGDAVVVAPNYALFPYESDLQLRELEALGAQPFRTPSGIVVQDAEKAGRAAFTHGVRYESGEVVPSLQALAEGRTAIKLTRRKNSTYFLHGLHRYKGKFYPQLAKSLINLSYVEPGEALIADPFGGSGTVALEAVINGFDAISIDCNPVAVAVARSKVSVAAMEATDALTALVEYREHLQHHKHSRRSLSQFPPDVLPELEQWFPRPVLQKLDSALNAARSVSDERIMRLLEVLISDAIRDVSQQEPKDLRIRRRAVPITDAPVIELICARVAEAERRIGSFWHALGDARQAFGCATINLADSSSVGAYQVLDGRRIDAVVSSPPYAAALPYIDTDRLSLAAVFGITRSERKSLEETMIGSREITGRRRAELEAQIDGTALPQSVVRFLRSYMAAVTGDVDAGFRKQQAPAVLLRYFIAMRDVLVTLRQHVTDGAPCWFVLGNSRSTIAGQPWIIPTIDAFVALAESAGFAVEERIAITVTREDILHSRNAITQNEIVKLAPCATTSAPLTPSRSVV